jgi:two-component system chemotaxis sensor kinase CheA
MTAPTESPEIATAPRATAARPAIGGATTTRVELEKIDRVVNMVGELVISQAMLGQVVHALPEEVRGTLLQVLDEVVHHTRELKDSVIVDARAASERCVSAHAAPGTRAGDQDGQESPA